MTNDLMTITQAADMLKISRQAVWKAIDKNRLPAENIGGIWLILKDDVLRYKENREAKKDGT